MEYLEQAITSNFSTIQGSLNCQGDRRLIVLQKSTEQKTTSPKIHACSACRDGLIPSTGLAHSLVSIRSLVSVLRPSVVACIMINTLSDPRMQGPSRHQSIGGEFDGMRSHSSHSSSSVQGYLAHQRFPPRINEAEHMAKRRAAAQRERELRNYHQEQQYNRSMSSDL